MRTKTKAPLKRDSAVKQPLRPSQFLNDAIKKAGEDLPFGVAIYCGQRKLPVIEALRLLAPDLFKRNSPLRWQP